MPDAVPRPLPLPDHDDAEYWRGARRHELLLQRNKVTGEHRFPPGPMVSVPGRQEWEWVKATGRGKVYSFTVIHHPAHPYWRDKLPYNVVLVELEEGARIVANLQGVPHDQIKIGMPVEVAFEDVADDVALPQFRLAPDYGQAHH